MIEISKALWTVLGIFILVVTLPGSLEVLLLTVGAWRKSAIRGGNIRRKVSLAVVIPAHNEASLIEQCITSIRESALCPDACAIVVVADNCTDETARLAIAAGARVLERRDEERRGKGYALQMAFDRLQEEGFDAFLVIDADSVVSLNLISAVKERLESGAPAVQCRYRVANRDASLRAGLMDAAFLAFNVLRPKGRSGWGFSAGILGNGFALHRETLQKLPYTAASIVEDLEYHLRLVAAGEKVDFIDQATVFGEMPGGSEAARSQRSRWEGGRLRMAREWVPRLIRGIARCQWRLAEPLLDLLTLPLAYQILLLLFGVALPAPFRQYAAGALAVTGVHVISASFLGERPWRTIRTLAYAPFYILWKVTTIAAVFSFMGPKATWVRTARESEAGGIAK